MNTRRDILSGLVGACAGVISWTLGSEVTDELRTSEVRHTVLQNETERRQSLSVLFESEGDSVFWETYELDPGEVVEVDGFDRVGDYRVYVQWGDLTRSRRLEAGTRAVAIVLAFPFGDEEILIRDVPFSSLSPSQQSVEYTQNTSAE
ncbi:hypothetical protein [Salinigranum salinum]|uniref:hypothetical protein n=1 Tax=Salinigranum salinum TaxID=1364937 RepID=UPI001260C5AE|nr:hypothetical protein [Salinigranum salinum]